MGTTVPLSPTSLIYLFADRLVPSSGFLGQGSPSPCGGVRVKTAALADLLVASAFWSLRTQGVIDLSLAVHRRLTFSSTHVEIDLLNLAPRPGLEGILVRNMSAAGRDEVGHVICRALPYSENPWREVVEEVDLPDIDCNDLADFERGFETVSSSWTEFRLHEPDLYEGLTHRCAKALRSCAEIYNP